MVAGRLLSIASRVAMVLVLLLEGRGRWSRGWKALCLTVFQGVWNEVGKIVARNKLGTISLKLWETWRFFDHAARGDGTATPMLGTATPLVGSGSATPVVWNAHLADSFALVQLLNCGSGPCFCSWFAKNLGLVVFTVSVVFHPSPVAWTRQWLSCSALFFLALLWKCWLWFLKLMSSHQEARWLRGRKRDTGKRKNIYYVFGTVCARPGTGTRSKKGGIASVTPSQKAVDSGVFLASTQSRTLIAVFF